ncbi:MAG: hypothetical protein R2941_02070 [Desulfobacterales bacterium]
MAEILLAFDLENAVVLTGDGYTYPVIRIVSRYRLLLESADCCGQCQKRQGSSARGETEIEVPDGAVDSFPFFGDESRKDRVTPVFTLGQKAWFSKNR